jgi:hypothetical protein
MQLLARELDFYYTFVEYLNRKLRQIVKSDRLLAGMRAASSTSATISTTRVLSSRWQVRVVTLGAFHAASRSSASPVKSDTALISGNRNTVTL